MKREIRIDVGRYEVVARCKVTQLSENATRLAGSASALDSNDLGRLELLAAIDVFTNAKDVDGRELKSARKTLGLRQPDLGKLLDVSVETISRWENGALTVQRQTRLAVLQLLERKHATGELTPIGIKSPSADGEVFSHLVA